MSEEGEGRKRQYRVYFRYLVVVDVEARSSEEAFDLARAEENETGEWETMDRWTEILDEGEDA